MPAYRYLLCDLLTDQLLGVVPFSGVTFDRRISRTGSLSATLNAPTPGLLDLARTVHAYAGRSALWVFRDNQLWWGGIPWTVQAKQGDRGPVSLSVQAATFDSYAHRRQLRANLTYAQKDQGHIIPHLWRTIQTDPRGNIGVEATDVATGVLRDRTYLVSEQAWVGKLIEDLGDVIDGPEHTIEVSTDADGNRVKRLRVAQRLGTTTPSVVFQRAARGGGRVLEWADTADAVGGGTAFRTRGDAPNGNVGEDTEPLLSAVRERTDLLDAGWPLLDVTEDRAGVIDVATLNGYADALRQELAGAARTSGYTVDVGSTGWSPNRLGDPVRIKLADGWHAGVDLTVRPVGCQVTAAETGTPESVTLLFGEDAA